MSETLNPNPGEKPEPQPQGSPSGGHDPGNVDGLKKALESERAARKEAERSSKDLATRLQELESTIKSQGDAAQQVQSLRQKIGEFERKEAKRDALNAAIQKAASEGFQVNRDAAFKAMEWRPGEDPTREASEIVDMFKVAPSTPGDPPPPQRTITGQPDKPAEAGDQKPNLSELYRNDPDAFRAYVEAQKRPRFMRKQ